MKFLALFVICFSFPFFLTASNDLLGGLRFTVIEEVEKFFYGSKIATVIGEHENLFTLMSYTDDLQKIFFNHFDKTKSELYEIAFTAFEEALKATGEFDKSYSMDIYRTFQRFLMGQSPALKEVEVLKISSSDEGMSKLFKTNSIEIDDFFDLNSFITDGCISFPSVGSLPSLQAPSDIQPSSKRSYGTDLDAKKWALAAIKLSRFYKNIYIFLKGISYHTTSSNFFSATKIRDNLEKIFNESAEKQVPFYKGSLVDHFSLEVEKYITTLEGEEQNIIISFRASLMEIGYEIYEEIKDEFNEREKVNEKEEAHADVQEYKRKRVETTTSPNNFPIIFHDQHTFFQNVYDEFKIDDEQFGIPSSKKENTGNLYGHGEEKVPQIEKEEEKDDDSFIDIASSEELELPEIVEFLNAPFNTLQKIVSSTNFEQFDEIRSIYFGLVARDFQEMDSLANILDSALIKVFKRK